MKYIFLTFYLLYSIFCYSQQSKVHGRISIQNSFIETGKRVYVSNAQIEDDYGRAQPTISDVSGRFTLVFVGVPDNTTISFNIRKPSTDLDVVNVDALTAISGQKDTIRITMAPKSKIADYRKNIYFIGRTSAEIELKKVLKRKNDELTLLKSGNQNNFSRIQMLESDLKT